MRQKSIVKLFEDNLDYLEGSAEFDARCKKAAEVAWTIRQLRPAAKQMGFTKAPFLTYLNHLARKAGVMLEPVTSWYGVGRTGAPGEVAGAVRLASLLGVAARQCRAFLKVGFAESQGEPVLAMLKANPDAVGGDALEQCEAVLAGVQWSKESRELIAALERAVKAEYGK